MHTVIAMTQGQIGYMLQQALQNEFLKFKKNKMVDKFDYSNTSI